MPAASAVYGTFLHPASAAAPSGRGGRAWTRTMSTQSSDSDEEITETRAVLWEVVHLRRESLLPDTARADANFLAAMVTVLGLVVVGVYGGVTVGGVMGAFVGMVRGGMGWQEIWGVM